MGDKTFMTQPLTPEGRLETHMGVVRHADILSKTPGSRVASSKGNFFRVQFPTTDDYLTKTRRLVTPIYPQDAATIVTLLDLHVDPPPHPSSTESRLPPLEILEAGTGHGSLTIALARAIHAANPAQPPPGSGLPAEPRNAIIHTTDASEKYSKHAQGIISRFRRGMYRPHIDFYTGTPEEFIETQFKLRSAKEEAVGTAATTSLNPDFDPARKAFLSVIVLDLPSPEEYLKLCEEALLPEGQLGIFCPHITQIANLVKMAKLKDIRLAPVKIIEFANGGAREWAVRLAKVRNPRPLKTKASEDGADGEETDSAPKAERWEMICRPKVGEMVVGGGFFVLFKKIVRVSSPVVVAETPAVDPSETIVEILTESPEEPLMESERQIVIPEVAEAKIPVEVHEIAPVGTGVQSTEATLLEVQDIVQEEVTTETPEEAPLEVQEIVQEEVTTEAPEEAPLEVQEIVQEEVTTETPEEAPLEVQEIVQEEVTTETPLETQVKAPAIALAEPEVVSSSKTPVEAHVETPAIALSELEFVSPSETSVGTPVETPAEITVETHVENSEIVPAEPEAAVSPVEAPAEVEAITAPEIDETTPAEIAPAVENVKPKPVPIALDSDIAETIERFNSDEIKKEKSKKSASSSGWFGKLFRQ
ncbi:S-adenosyl-L-methionine-dependent methyltransferase [Peziza echinospora]|nr:S-adenosyl-L-methionine-dependent methyltransferase [Peziza echinospora]